jgi:hypothetical protein
MRYEASMHGITNHNYLEVLTRLKQQLVAVTASSHTELIEFDLRGVLEQIRAQFDRVRFILPHALWIDKKYNNCNVVDFRSKLTLTRAFKSFV